MGTIVGKIGCQEVHFCMYCCQDDLKFQRHVADFDENKCCDYPEHTIPWQTLLLTFGQDEYVLQVLGGSHLDEFFNAVLC